MTVLKNGTRVTGKVYSLRWLVTEWHNKSPKTLTYSTRVRIIGGISPHITTGLLYTYMYNGGLRTSSTVHSADEKIT
jgi:hypothetical protein